MDTLKQIDAQMTIAHDELTAAQNRFHKVESRRRKVLAAEWVVANTFTLDEIEMSDGDNKPWFGHIKTFGEWLSENSNKRFAEWNGRIYFTSELAAGRLGCNGPSLRDAKEAMAETT